MFLPQQQQRPQPMFFGQDPNMQAQIAQQQMPQPPQAQPQQGNPLLDALKARQMADSMQGGMNQIQAQDPFGALAKGISGGLEGWAQAKATELETQNQQAADKEITDALASDDPLKALSRSESPEGRAAYRQLRLADLSKKPTEKWTDVDNNGDGLADEQVNSASGERKVVDRPLTYEQQIAKARAGAANTTVNVAGEKAFEKGTGEFQAKMFGDMATEGVNAKGELANIGTLRANLAKLPGGISGGLQGLASEWGIKLGPNASNVELASSLIAKLIPAQRVPGSGASSDLDVKMFTRAVPNLMNTPQGNALLLDTMEALAQFKHEQGKIAAAAMNGQVTRQQATEVLLNLPDPMAKFKAAKVGGSVAAPARKVLKFNPATGMVE